MKTKSIKDAVHGYIQLEEPFWRMIDTAEFQRLKWLEQTSYRVLYPSARHDRFIHSIGTYYLGQKAFEGFSKNSGAILGEDKVSCFRNSFLSACLLHDIGHAPFSHTCEDLYNYREKISDINSKLNQLLLKSSKSLLTLNEYFAFCSDYKYIITSKDEVSKPPSEHEVMSSIVIIHTYKKFSTFFEKTDFDIPSLDLMIRAVLGCVYPVSTTTGNEEKIEKGIKNCLIRLLNSSTVDVDKLDYIARDTMMSGYENVILDNDRLLSSASFIVKDNVYFPAFNKSALSVINNVITAKNAQAKWIVNHPVVIYEYYLLRKSIGISLKNIYDRNFSGDKSFSYDQLLNSIFSYDAISETGVKVGDLIFILLSDIDIIHCLKENIKDKNVSEFFKRDQRKKPIWKSNEEYLYCLGDMDNACEVSDFFAPLITYLDDIEDLYHPKTIDESMYNNIKADKDLFGSEYLIEIIDVLKEYCLNNNAEFNFVILPAKNKFSAKINSRQTYISFGNDGKSYITYHALQVNEELNEVRQYEFFYLYSNSKINAKSFLEYIYQRVHQAKSFRC